jgi:phosphate starvation-inducible PhoH-like protein
LHTSKGKIVKAITKNQRKILCGCQKNDMIFVIGPAGTGKTYTSVAIAVKSLKNKQVKRLIFTRPAIEAGENLGFLPGDVKEKLDPYMQPIYDALTDMLSAKKVNKYIDEGIIQIAPLAFMRGRTLDNAFVILDEGQNTTEKQMKMFLTRMGISAKFIITGDISQIDLLKTNQSGLVQAQKKLINIKDISFIQLDDKDVIRHKLVKQIIKAYEPKH